MCSRAHFVKTCKAPLLHPTIIGQLDSLALLPAKRADQFDRPLEFGPALGATPLPERPH